ncbi:MAG: substrate-binding domain-containing protein [Erythrobacter sp.]|nr:substrate-binding domain-containing protein [Erythrobacter sp.]
MFGEFFSEIVRGIDMVTHGAGKNLLLGNMHGSADETVLAIRAMRGRVDGLLVMPPNSQADDIEAVTRDIPTVLMNAHANDGRTPFVAVDNYAGARLVTEHLIDRGATKIVHIAGPASNRDARERQRGYCDVLLERLGESSPLILPGDFREDAGRKAARLLLNGDIPFDAVFAGNDIMAVDFMTEMRTSGRKIGEDLLVAGFDDIPLARYVSPGLTTVHSDITRLGSTAALMMLRMMKGEELDQDDSLIIAPTLAVRGSTAAGE